jgi:hypothetical protein
MTRNLFVPIGIVGLLTLFLAPPTEGQNAVDRPPAGTAAGKGLTQLPFFRDEVPAEYREFLPLPVGFSLIYVHQNMPLNLADTAVVIPGIALPPGLVRGGTVKAVTNSYLARIDAWILPFLNIYGTAGRFNGSAREIKMDLAMPVPLPIPPEVSYKGSNYGIGVTGAFGYHHFFALYDFNWTSVSPDVTNKIKLYSQGLRAGVHIVTNGIRSRIYGGVTRMDITGRAQGTVLLQSGIPATFDIKVRTKPGWNPLVGFDVQLSRHFSVTAEAAFGSTKQIMIAPGFRF